MRVRDAAGSGQGRKQWRETAISEYVWQVKLTDGADGLDGSSRKERGIMGNS